jgi:arylsulfatase A
MNKETSITRRSFVRHAMRAGLGLSLCPCLGQTQSPRNRPPNFVFFILDDMQRHMFNCLPEGRGKNLTPHLDRLASEGVLMRGQHVVSPVCTPSRYNCLTGRYASRALRRQAESGTQRVVTWNTHIRAQDLTLPKLLKQQGYATGFVGKNHVVHAPAWKKAAWEADPSDPAIKTQLDRNAAAARAALHNAGFDYAERIYHNNPDANGPVKLAVHNLDWIVEGGLDFIDRYRDNPFFLYIASTIPHGPGAAERSWNADPRITSDGILNKAPQGLPLRSSIPKRLARAGISTPGRENLLWLNDALGAIMTRLEKHGLDENTIVVFFNDHGQAAKGTLYQGGVSNPSILWRKGGFPCGSVSDALISNIDFAPTLLDYAGTAPTPGQFDGTSFRPILEGQTRDWKRTLFFELGYARALRKGPWKYLALRYPESVRTMSPELRQKKLQRVNQNLRRRGRPIITEDPMAPFSHVSSIPGGGDAEHASTGKYPAYYDADQLYNLDDDPNEQENLAHKPAYASVLAAMKQEMTSHLSRLPGSFAELKPAPE